MGERTQALIEVNVGTETKASFSLHYQWGYGRAMLMDLWIDVNKVDTKREDT